MVSIFMVLKAQANVAFIWGGDIRIFRMSFHSLVVTKYPSYMKMHTPFGIVIAISILELSHSYNSEINTQTSINLTERDKKHFDSIRPRENMSQINSTL